MTTGAGATAAYAANQRQDAQRCFMAGAAHAAGIEPQLLPEGGQPLSDLAVHAYHQRNLDELQRLCLRAEAGLAPTGVQQLTDAQLEDRIGRIHVLLAGAYDEQQRRGRTRSQRQAAERAAWLASEEGKSRSLDPSDA